MSNLSHVRAPVLVYIPVYLSADLHARLSKELYIILGGENFWDYNDNKSRSDDARACAKCEQQEQSTGPRCRAISRVVGRVNEVQKTSSYGTAVSSS